MSHPRISPHTHDHTERRRLAHARDRERAKAPPTAARARRQGRGPLRNKHADQQQRPQTDHKKKPRFRHREGGAATPAARSTHTHPPDSLREFGSIKATTVASLTNQRQPFFQGDSARRQQLRGQLPEGPLKPTYQFFKSLERFCICFANYRRKGGTGHAMLA